MTPISVALSDDAATTRLGADLAAAAKAGDVFALHGDLGAGKTTLARGFVRQMAGDPDLDVPSPTFTFVQTYEGRIPVRHFDLYRIGGMADLDELGFEDEQADTATLIEWPERAGEALPAERVDIELAHEGEGRRATISGAPKAMARIARSLDIRAFLAGAGAEHAHRTFLLGDASTRAYETIYDGEDPVRILMNAPRQPDGPPIRDGKPYSQIAHLAESVTPFVAIGKALVANGFSAPQIHAQNLDSGLLLIEHLGSQGVLDENGTPVAQRYITSAEVLAAIHQKEWPRDMEAAPGVVHRLPAYDREAMAIETELVTDWYMPAQAGKPTSAKDRAEYAAAWSSAFDRLEMVEKSIVLRDYHSPNLIWRGDRQGLDRVGIIDFQDALWGPSTYDVASLAQDARVTISPELENEIVAAYLAARKAGGAFDEAGFREAYAIMAAQRNSKILGIFIRLNVRDGKPAYLRHLPRIRDYVSRSLTHPALAQLRDFYESRGLLKDAS
ncbi:MAG: tRNA (adenosine(37)-N6)-threonylcarbamoyltransferase complex ATPase subunit type 1 TsaE [Mesorhizobium sp.]